MLATLDTFWGYDEYNIHSGILATSLEFLLILTWRSVLWEQQSQTWAQLSLAWSWPRAKRSQLLNQWTQDQQDSVSLPYLSIFLSTRISLKTQNIFSLYISNNLSFCLSVNNTGICLYQVISNSVSLFVLLCFSCKHLNLLFLVLVSEQLAVLGGQLLDLILGLVTL